MRDNNRVFLNQYSELEKNLKMFYQRFTGGSIVLFHIDKLKKSFNVKDRERAKSLDSVRTLRNFLVHEADIVDGDAFIVSDRVVEFLIEENQRLIQPITAMEVCTKVNDLYFATVDSILKDTIVAMVKNGYSHVPVLDKKKCLLGVFSASTLLAFIHNNAKLEINPDSLIKDYISHLDINTHFNECYKFISMDESVDNIIDIFEKRKINNKRLVMLFVTNSGGSKETILGIITPYDVINNG